MADIDLMLALPEVAYLVERVPIARVVLEPTPLHLRFCQHARDSRMSLKDQCRLLGIPWHARRVLPEVADEDCLRIARGVPATLFIPNLPQSRDDQETWLGTMMASIDALGQKHMPWVARNGLELWDMWGDIQEYLRTTPSIPAGTLPKTIFTRVEKEREVRARLVAEAEAARREEERRNQAILTAIRDGPIEHSIEDDAYVISHLGEVHRLPRHGLTATQTREIERRLLVYGNTVRLQPRGLQPRDGYYVMDDPLALRQGYTIRQDDILQWQRREMAAMQQRNNYLLGADWGAQAAQQQPRTTDDRPIAYPLLRLEERTFGKYRIKLLNTHEEFAEEARKMVNCVEGTYWDRAKRGICHIVSVSERGLMGWGRVATAEFSARWEQATQVKGRGNAAVPATSPIRAALRGFGQIQREIANV